MIEGEVTAFAARQNEFKKKAQANVEREFKAKQTQESYVIKARDKYEQDCLRINSFTAQATLVHGKDLVKINQKKERAEQSVGANERDFANFAKAYDETAARWEEIWKTYCDWCQDLEEERMELMRDNLWAYANTVSAVCVADDEVGVKTSLSLLRSYF